MIRHIASRVSGTAISTGRFAVGIPLGVARTLLDHVPFGASRRGEGETAAEGSGAADAVSADVPHAPVEDQATAKTKPSTAPPTKAPTKARRTAPKAGTPKSGEPGRTHDEGPKVVLTIDTPPEDIEPPVDVVGEALQAEQQQVEPPAEVGDDDPVVYSTSSDDR